MDMKKMELRNKKTGNVFDEAQVKLPLWKRFYLWTWGRRHWKHISIWVLKEEE